MGIQQTQLLKQIEIKNNDMAKQKKDQKEKKLFVTSYFLKKIQRVKLNDSLFTRTKRIFKLKLNYTIIHLIVLHYFSCPFT